VLAIRHPCESAWRRWPHQDAVPDRRCGFECPGVGGRARRPIAERNPNRFEGFEECADPRSVRQRDGIGRFVGGLAVAPFEEPTRFVMNAVDRQWLTGRQDLDRMLGRRAIGIVDAIGPRPDHGGFGRPVEDGDLRIVAHAPKARLPQDLPGDVEDLECEPLVRHVDVERPYAARRRPCDQGDVRFRSLDGPAADRDLVWAVDRVRLPLQRLAVDPAGRPPAPPLLRKHRPTEAGHARSGAAEDALALVLRRVRPLAAGEGDGGFASEGGCGHLVAVA